MGWAPNFLYTGLCFSVGILTICSFLAYNCPLLLDNEPLSVAGATIDIFARGVVVLGLFWITHPSCQNTGETTAARSQVREPRIPLRGRLLFTLILTLLSVCSGEVGGEGYVTSMGDVRAEALHRDFAPRLSAKQHGLEPQQIQESHQTGKQRAVCKRSFLRACNRASIHGHTWYKGKIFTASQLGVNMQAPSVYTSPPNVLPPKPVQRRRLTCFSWNCNGLPPDHWDFLTQWM